MRVRPFFLAGPRGRLHCVFYDPGPAGAGQVVKVCNQVVVGVVIDRRQQEVIVCFKLSSGFRIAFLLKFDHVVFAEHQRLVANGRSAQFQGVLQRDAAVGRVA